MWVWGTGGRVAAGTGASAETAGVAEGALGGVPGRSWQEMRETYDSQGLEVPGRGWLMPDD